MQSEREMPLSLMSMPSVRMNGSAVQAISVNYRHPLILFVGKHL